MAEVAGLRAEAGRVPVSWDECADWLDAGQTITYQTKRAKGRIFPGLADEVRRDGIEGIPLDAVRLQGAAGRVRDRRATGMKIRPIFAWYDLWVGIYIDRENRRVYVLPVPCFGIVIDWRRP